MVCSGGDTLRGMSDEANPKWRIPAGPCGTCPYAKATPPGVWHPEEYAILPEYDGETWQQVGTVPFCCHYDNGELCGGWLGSIDLEESLALRVAVASGTVEPAVFDYATDVECWESGAAAAAHGLGDPTPETAAAVRRIERFRGMVGR